MSVTAIDTHEVVKELVAAGSTDGQVEAVTRVVRRAQDVDVSNLATKSDLRETELRLDAKLEASNAELVRSVFGATGFQTLLIVGAVIAITKVFGH